ncbi:putative PEP-CTERM system TPR-repeat lipoprotein [Duganella sp. CF458]|uniref:XrtA/PEP-CTERM system TPR-repeat protein PrsT n=1 Tax=Duganella sp. CF458 TaxID=1884368 RepID=UPI0008EBEFD8|nr:XrtA/PEP-CTERM system TPR-repeat protein PrsT [Duganella sp. CF458]SFF70437.1 putative PEP-CTERM system TPR-repeat lipoprotein [Duganella sp. CF458]
MPRRENRGAPRALAIFGSLMLAAGLSGCLKSETSASLMAQAQQHLQRGETKAALIQLRNAAAKSPDDAAIRYQLASVYNAYNEPAAAEKEIRKALSLHFERAQALPQLVRALVAQDKAQAALDETADDAKNAGPALLAARADAWLAVGDSDQARDGYARALAAQPGLAAALLGQGNMAWMAKDGALALTLAEQAVQANPKDPSVFRFKGSVLRHQGKHEAALDALGLALALQPDHLSARVERADLEIEMKRYDAAKADIAALDKITPNSPYALYLQALLDHTRGKYTDAQGQLLKLLKLVPNHMPTVLLAGANELKLDNATAAQGFLNAYLERNPDNMYARKLLAQALLKTNQPAEAAAALAPLLRSGAQDAQLLVLAGESNLRNKDYQAAQQYFEKAAAIMPNEATLHTSLGLAQLGQGRVQQAVEQLGRATALDPKSEQAALYLIRSEISLGRYDKALAAVKAYQAAQPDNAVVRNMEGGIYLAQKNVPAARAAFEKAVALQPTQMAAMLNLAQLDLQEHQTDAARKRFATVLQHDPHHVGAMTALADIAVLQNQPEQAVRWLEQAVAEQPKAAELGIRLARAYLKAGQHAKATTLARQLQVGDAKSPALSELLGQVQLANNDGAGALESFGKMVQQDPKSAPAWFGMAAAHLMLKNAPAASSDLKKALAIDPKYRAARLALAEIAQQQNRPAEVLAIARQMQKEDGQQAAGYVMEGDLLVRQQKYQEAVALYEKAYGLDKQGRIVLAIHRTLLAAGLPRDADARLARYRQEQPGDLAATMYAAELSLSRKQFPAAVADLERVLKAAPDSPVALNNLAWAYSEMKDPRALPTAEKALQAAPDSAAILDTTGWLLVGKGDTARAVPMLKRASALQPANAMLRYHLAVALNQSGDKKAAKVELERLVSGGTPFPHLDDAIALLKVLNGS